MIVRVLLAVLLVVGFVEAGYVRARDLPPPCGLSCIVSLATQSCSLTNVTCICSNATLNAEIASCVQAKCTVKQQLVTKKYSQTSCGVEQEDRAKLVLVVPLVFGPVVLLAFALRVMARLCTSTRSFGADDWTMLFAVILGTAMSFIAIPLTKHGLGKNIWNLSPDDITAVLWYYYWDELIYLAAIPLTKISILLFYLKIFPQRALHILVYLVIGLNVVYLIAFEAVSIFQCSPIQGAWLAWDGEFKATCRNINVQAWLAAAFNIVLDVATLALPLPLLAKLSISTRKKVEIMFMFSLGFFVTIISIIRLQSILGYATTKNPTQDYTAMGVWSTVEVPVGMLCACLPAIRSLLRSVFPKLLDTSVSKSSRSKTTGGQYSNLSSGLSSKPRIGTPKIFVTQEWAIMSRHVDETGSYVELTDVAGDTKGSGSGSAAADERATENNGAKPHQTV